MIRFYHILDSRGNPSVAGLYNKDGVRLRVAVPSGASTGVHEALELRDGGDAFLGKGVLKAVENAQRTAEQLDWTAADVLVSDKRVLEIDGTENKSRLGANATLALSLLQTVVQAQQAGIEPFQLVSQLSDRKPQLPVPFANIINGGRHADTKLTLQEFMIVPHKATSFFEATKQVSETYHILRGLIAKKYSSLYTALGDEGGFAPDIDAHQALDLLMEAMKESGYDLGIAIDAAASEFYEDGKYKFKSGDVLSPEQLVDFYVGLLESYPIISLEDPFDQDDFASFALLRSKVEKANIDCQIVGDDLTVTNPKRIALAAEKNACDCLLLKINQIGTISEALEAARLSFESGWNVMVSHRSGETEDVFIADLATGLGSGQIKLGAPARGERTAKYNRLLEIELMHGLSYARWS